MSAKRCGRRQLVPLKIHSDGFAHTSNKKIVEFVCQFKEKPYLCKPIIIKKKMSWHYDCSSPGIIEVCRDEFVF